MPAISSQGIQVVVCDGAVLIEANGECPVGVVVEGEEDDLGGW